MHCPFCGTEDTKVVDSRLTAEGDQVRRRRECISCSERFTTYEVAELMFPRIVKRGGNRVPFDENKLRGGMLKALEKRPVAVATVDAAVARIKHRLSTLGEREIAARELGEWVMDELRAMDEVAYVRFASVYRRFQDIKAFQKEIARLEKSTRPTSEPQE